MFGFGKGKIEIGLTNYSFSPGQAVEGTVTLKLKKPLHGKALTINLHGQERIRSGQPGKGTDHIITLFDFTLPLDGERDYLVGESKTYPFKIVIPADVNATPSRPDGALGTVLKTAQMFSGVRRQVSWYLVARLDVKGLDVTKRVEINVA